MTMFVLCCCECGCCCGFVAADSGDCDGVVVDVAVVQLGHVAGDAAVLADNEVCDARAAANTDLKHRGSSQLE